MRRDRLEELVKALLWEGYALYPYTPGATKNATPTPFGIVYPPAYADGNPHQFARIRMQCILEGPGEATGEVRFLQAGVERRVGPGDFDFDGLRGNVAVDVQRFDELLARVTVTVENRTDVPSGLDRTTAMASALLSTHVLARVEGEGRFLSNISPPDHGAAAVMACAAVNTFPVLACDEDDVMLGATIMLPDHPELAPESRGDLFDGTEIEEALLLHVLALSDSEREQIEDPAVKAMIERAVAATPQDIIGLHGRTTMGDVSPTRMRGVGEAGEAGAPEATVAGITYRPGARLRLHADGATAHDHLLTGRTATLERIYVDYEDGVHLGVTIDDDPGAELMRDIGRYHYFKPDDVEVL